MCPNYETNNSIATIAYAIPKYPNTGFLENVDTICDLLPKPRIKYTLQDDQKTKINVEIKLDHRQFALQKMLFQNFYL